jgi:hypothetical protein
MAKPIEIVAVVPRQDANRYMMKFNVHDDMHVHLMTELTDGIAKLNDRNHHTDVFVLNHAVPDADNIIQDLRQSHPRLLIVLVDEEADFAIPGNADAISTDPFTNDDLVRQIQSLMSDRQLETLRADSLPAVRRFAKDLREASGEIGKLQAAAASCVQMDYPYVAIYRQNSDKPITLTLKADEGPKAIRAVAPTASDENDLMGWVARTGDSRIASYPEELNHPLVAKGRLGTVACVPVNISGTRYGVLVACREIPGSISQENILILELISAQLASALSKEGIH